LGVSRIEIYTQSERILTEEEKKKLTVLVKRRLQGEPVSYLLGQREFFSLSLFVTEDVLIPRPETELLVEKAIHVIDEKFHQGVKKLRVLDVGTGSGAISIALKQERPNIDIVAIDKSKAALKVAQKNRDYFGMDFPLLRANLLDGISNTESVDMILSNPPYIPSSQIQTLAKEVQKEPILALDGGEDGLRLIRRLILDARDRLCPFGLLMMEVGDGQTEKVCSLMKQAGYEEVGIAKDLAQIPRIVFGKHAKKR